MHLFRCTYACIMIKLEQIYVSTFLVDILAKNRLNCYLAVLVYSKLEMDCYIFQYSLFAL